MYKGDIRLGETIDIKFTTRRFTTGAPFTLAGTPVVSAYPGNSTTQLTAGITLTVDFDGVTGLNNIRVVATGGNGYATATNYTLVITTGTVDGVSVVGECVGSFSIENRSAVMPTTAARTLDVSATGEAGIDWANIGSPTTAQNLSATNIDVDQVVASVSGAVGSIAANGISTASFANDAITAAKIANGAIDAATFAAGAIDAAAIANGAIDAATFAAGAIDAAAIANGAIDAATFAAGAIDAAAIANGAIDAATFAAGAITAAVIATDAIDADALAADAVAEIQSGLATSAALATVQADTDNIQTRLPAALVGGRMDSSVGAMAANVLTASALAADAVVEIQAAILSDATPFPGARIDATISSRATPAQVNVEVLDVISVDTFAEPTGVPPATDTLANKIGRQHQALRNRIDVDANTGKKQFFDDAGVALWEKDFTDAANVYSETEGNAP